MAEYYVVRDKNTGLYFRGKGANRWGKYYNQATIYRVKAMVEHTIKEIAWHGEQAEIVPIRITENPTDTVEVVRCKDCEFRIWDDVCKEDYCNNVYGLNGAITDNDFCSYGEKRGDSR